MYIVCVYFPVQPARCENQLEQVCVDIDKTINQTIQNTLNTLEKDCETIARLTAEKLEKDRYAFVCFVFSSLCQPVVMLAIAAHSVVLCTSCWFDYRDGRMCTFD